jgi:hypothetical protein
LGRWILGALLLSDTKTLETDGHGHEDHGHGGGRKHKHPSSTEPSDDQGDHNCVHQAPALVGDIDSGLCVVGGVSHHGEEKILVVREKGVAAHLREKTEEDSDEDTTAHTLRAEHVQPRLLGMLHLDLDGGSNLRHLSLHEYRASVSLGMVLCKNGESLVIAVFGDEPSRTLWQEARRC